MNSKSKGIAIIWLIIAGFVLIVGGGLWYYALRDIVSSSPDPHLPFYGINLKINNVYTPLKLTKGGFAEISWEAASSREYNIRNCKGSGAPQNFKFNQNLANSGTIKEIFKTVGEYELVIKCTVEKNNSSSFVDIISDSIKVAVANATISQETATWKTYRNEKYGFEFKYPSDWQPTYGEPERPDLKVLGRVLNPARSGKQDTDVPIEQFLIRSYNYSCKGSPVNLLGKNAIDTGWRQGFGLISYRELCTELEDRPIVISFSAFDEKSQKIMDQILSTFRFL